ncbi:MAG: hypothetical protein LBE76_04095 [Nitrososphaerota archaeon]|nr:hypothetical protein [Nitrososphaerota archaeon]
MSDIERGRISNPVLALNSLELLRRYIKTKGWLVPEDGDKPPKIVREQMVVANADVAAKLGAGYLYVAALGADKTVIEKQIDISAATEQRVNSVFTDTKVDAAFNQLFDAIDEA